MNVKLPKKQAYCKLSEVGLKEYDSTGGAFPCPRCRSIIDPEDTTTYTLIVKKTETHKDEVKSMFVNCRECGTEIKLTDFGKTQKQTFEVERV